MSTCEVIIPQDASGPVQEEKSWRDMISTSCAEGARALKSIQKYIYIRVERRNVPKSEAIQARIKVIEERNKSAIATFKVFYKSEYAAIKQIMGDTDKTMASLFEGCTCGCDRNSCDALKILLTKRSAMVSYGHVCGNEQVKFINNQKNLEAALRNTAAAIEVAREKMVIISKRVAHELAPLLSELARCQQALVDGSGTIDDEDAIKRKIRKIEDKARPEKTAAKCEFDAAWDAFLATEEQSNQNLQDIEAFKKAHPPKWSVKS